MNSEPIDVREGTIRRSEQRTAVSGLKHRDAGERHDTRDSRENDACAFRTR